MIAVLAPHSRNPADGKPIRSALAETRCRTLRDQAGQEIAGRQVIDAICKKIVTQNTGGRWDRMNRYRMQQIRAELGRRADGAQLLAEFETLGDIPAAA